MVMVMVYYSDRNCKNGCSGAHFSRFSCRQIDFPFFFLSLINIKENGRFLMHHKTVKAGDI